MYLQKLLPLDSCCCSARAATSQAKRLCNPFAEREFWGQKEGGRGKETPPPQKKSRTVTPIKPAPPFLHLEQSISCSSLETGTAAWTRRRAGPAVTPFPPACVSLCPVTWGQHTVQDHQPALPPRTVDRRVMMTYSRNIMQCWILQASQKCLPLHWSRGRRCFLATNTRHRRWPGQVHSPGGRPNGTPTPRRCPTHLSGSGRAAQGQWLVLRSELRCRGATFLSFCWPCKWNPIMSFPTSPRCRGMGPFAELWYRNPC